MKWTWEGYAEAGLRRGGVQKDRGTKGQGYGVSGILLSTVNYPVHLNSTLHSTWFLAKSKSPKSTFSCYIYQRLSAVYPLLRNLIAPKLRPMSSQIEWQMALYLPIREPQDVTSLWRARNHLLRLTMGLAASPLQSHINSINSNSVTSELGSNDGKTCTLYTGTRTLFLH